MKFIKTLLIFGFLTFISSSIMAQTKIYKDDSKSYFDIIYTYEDGKFYKGGTTSFTAIAYTYSDNKIYGIVKDFVFLKNHKS